MPDDIDNGEHGVDVPLPQSAAGAGQPVNPASPGAVPPTGTLVSSSIPPRPPPIDTPQSPFRCAELPVELALAIFEQCDKNTQLNICRVSKGIRSITIGVLFRDIVLEFDMDTSENKILQTLRWINQVAAEHCQSFGIDTKNIEYFLGGTIVDVNRDPTTVEPAELPIDEPTRIMGEVLLKMVKLQEFCWESMDFPNNYILGALEKLPFLRKLKLIKNEFASVDLLGEQSYLKLFSKHFMITQITTLDIGEIISLDVLLALRSLFQKSPALTDLCLRFGDLWTDEYESENPNACLHWIDDLFAPFTVPYSSTPQYHYLSRLTVINGLHDPEEMGANFHNTFSTAFKNLDCVAFYGYGGNNYLLDHLNISGIRLRKLRIVCHDQNWEPITRIFCDAKLELLHLELELDAPGLKYNSLIPLICLSKDSLRELRLITISRRHSKLNSLEIMEENVAKQLVHSCRRLQNLELTADFKPGVWRSVQKDFVVCLSELVSFGIQRTANLGSRDPSGSPSTASREEATSFANAFITNSNSRSKGESSANVSLKYVVFDEYKVTICRKAGAYVPVGSQLREPQDERLGLRERLGWPPRFMIKKD